MAIPNGDPLVIGGGNRAVGDRTLTTEQELSLVLQKETLHPYQQELVVGSRTRKQMLKGGKSYQWVVNGKVDSGYRTTLGAYEIGNDSYRNNEIQVYIDREITTMEEVHEYDEFTQWWDVRSPIITESGRKLGRDNEQKACRSLFVSAATDMPAGSDYTDIAGANDMRTAAARAESVVVGGTTRAFLQASDGTALVDAIRNVAVKTFEMGDNPALYSLYLSPTDYSWFAATEAAKEVVDRDFSSNKGDYAAGILPRIKKIAIEEASGIGTAAFTNVNGGLTGGAAYERNDYVNDNSAVLGVIARVDKAVGCVGLYDMETDVFWDPRTDTWNFRAKTCLGFGPLESQCAFALTCAAS